MAPDDKHDLISGTCSHLPLLREADGYSRQAHRMQTKLIEQDAGEARQPMTLIMVHAQDHLMNSLLARELCEEILHLYQR
uniref:PTS lactose/cellobiose transporter subunit IIA n=1 Tax=Atlantibacter subterraneus TaxID=255519 RepID=UPI0028ACFD7B|nr:PTS lactose/cellobiose transporter subunit IIA [Atlantibacter subterranea]